MLPDAPATCAVCGAAMSHDSQHYQALRLTARVFECGGAVCIADGGHLYPALACPKSSAIIAELRAENARLRAQFKQAGEVIDEQIARREHVLAGGEIGDSPTRWRKGEVK